MSYLKRSNFSTPWPRFPWTRISPIVAFILGLHSVAASSRADWSPWKTIYSDGKDCSIEVGEKIGNAPDYYSYLRFRCVGYTDKIKFKMKLFRLNRQSESVETIEDVKLKPGVTNDDPGFWWTAKSFTDYKILSIKVGDQDTVQVTETLAASEPAAEHVGLPSNGNMQNAIDVLDARAHKNAQQVTDGMFGFTDDEIRRDDRIGWKCAAFVAGALRDAGYDVPTVKAAKDYGPALIHAGFLPITVTSDYIPKAGDVAVFPQYTLPAGNGSEVVHPWGHMSMYDGKQWISNFVQPKEIGPYPSNSARAQQIEYVVYRHPN